MADRKLFDLGLNATPSLTRRIAIGELGALSENMTLEQLLAIVTTDLDVYTQDEVNALLLEYLSKTNLTPYTPTSDYHPATKKYVDDASNASYVTITNTGANVSNFIGRVAQADNVVTFNGKFDDNNLQDGDTIFTLPVSITAPAVDIYFHCANPSGGGGARIKIAAGSKVALVEDQESGTGATLTFNAIYLISN